MKNWIVLLIAVFMVNACFLTVDASERKKKTAKKEETVVKPPVKKLSKYERLFKGKSHEMAKGGFMTLHKVDGKLYFEMPLAVMGRDMLLASTTTQTSDNSVSTNGYKVKDPMHICFTLADSMVHMRKVNSYVSYDKNNDRLQRVIDQNFVNPIIEGYKVLAYNPDSTAVVFEMTALFTGGDAAVTPMVDEAFPLAFRNSINKSLSAIDCIKAFEDNVSIKSSLSYNVSAKYLNTILYENRPVSIKATRTLLLLPEDRMRPRISDSRIGIFLTNKQYIANEADQLQRYSLAHRWRLEPKDMEAYKRGELVEPVKPIVFYLDNLFPEEWKQPIRTGVMRWNKAFEKIGFKNVVQVLDFPTNDPNFDPDNLKYSCIRYVPSSTQNAMGPSWVDPMTGEILNASILVYNDIVKMLNYWRFVQTAQIDPRVRSKKLPKDVLEETMAYVLAHEMGHYLGLLHPFVDGKGNFGDYCDDTPDYCVNGYETFLSELDETFPYSDDNYRKVIQRVALNGRVFIADNIMDYEFGYLDRFTLEQRKRVRTVLENAWLLPGPKIEVEPRARSGKKAVKPSVPKPVS
mgnify:CR=1 FL=1